MATMWSFSFLLVLSGLVAISKCEKRIKLVTTRGFQIFMVGETVEFACSMQSSSRPEMTIFSDYEPKQKRIKTDEKNTEDGMVFYMYMSFIASSIDNARTFLCRVMENTETIHSDPFLINIGIPPNPPVVTGPMKVVVGKEYTWSCLTDGGGFYSPKITFLTADETSLLDSFGVSWSEYSSFKIIPNQNYVYTKRLTIIMSVFQTPFSFMCEVMHPSLLKVKWQRVMINLTSEYNGMPSPSNSLLIDTEKSLSLMKSDKRSKCNVAMMSHIDNFIYLGTLREDNTLPWPELVKITGVELSTASGFTGNLCVFMLDQKDCNEEQSTMRKLCYCNAYNAALQEYTVIINFTSKAQFSQGKIALWKGHPYFERTSWVMLMKVIESKQFACTGSLLGNAKTAKSENSATPLKDGSVFDMLFTLLFTVSTVLLSSQ
ncbi:uncharacterized protein LOC106061025 [Biomphalaria glabrata]|uniref:Uncharacterized protein LOC106061025 n=1 Tax=Biomphalaria glabrata TaxID=6526 RepID=A0A9W2YKE0_BIOGL|nr:uncharacterized protein LOC106061025 [Biomphalaria glabrata]XP_055863122.1 uncharacterized protein LOC106061025 [Biomphalaria glabrata]KAI8753582.1 hypothetical protein BgiMline_014137 [Biomphalaria glabrata]